MEYMWNSFNPLAVILVSDSYSLILFVFILAVFVFCLSLNIYLCRCLFWYCCFVVVMCVWGGAGGGVCVGVCGGG